MKCRQVTGVASESKNLEKIAGRVVRNGLLGAFAAKAAARVAERAGKKNGVAAELLPIHAFILEEEE